MELLDSGRIEATWVDFEKSDELVKLLDAGKEELPLKIFLQKSLDLKIGIVNLYPFSETVIDI
jgi:hypothetical protein